MEVKKIQEELARLVELIDGWASSHDISGIEKDVALDKLKILYEAVRFIRCDDPAFTAPIPAPQSIVEPVHEAEVSIDLEEMLASSISVVESESATSTEAFDRSSTPEIVLAEESAARNIPSLAATPGPVLAESRTDKTDGEETASERAPKGEASHSLFDLDDLVTRHREKRRVIMSLYETETTRESVREFTPSAASSTEEPHTAPGASELPDEVTTTYSVSTVQETVEEEQDEPDLVLLEVASEAAPWSAGEKYPARSAVLGEVIGGGIHTLADSMIAPKDMASEIRRQERISDLKQAIGINDKFLLIRDLFEGDAEAYEAALTRLNAFDDLDDCMIFVAENYDWNPGSDGARLLMELLERKLS